MSQNINLAVSGIYTSINDYNGLPPGALDAADNIEVRYKNVAEPRRGFEGLTNSNVPNIHFIKITNFYINNVDSVIGLTSDDDLVYYTGANPWPSVPGNVSSNIIAPNAVDGKCKFVRAGQNLYVTAQDGIRSLSSGNGAKLIRAGVPKGLNLSAATNGNTSGFFTNNIVRVTTGDISSGGADIANIADATDVIIGSYVAGTSIPANTTVTVIADPTVIVIETGDLVATMAAINSLASVAGLSVGTMVSGAGIPPNAVISSIVMGVVNMNLPAFQTLSTTPITFTAPRVITMSNNATGTHAGTTLTFYSGAQVGYRMVFGRVETDVNGSTITRLGVPSAIAIATNILGTPTNTTVTGTIPKNSSDELTFVQLYRSSQTATVNLTPLDQYNLVYERLLVAGDFTTRTITITDDVPDSLIGIPLYSGSDQEGALQTNSPPPMAWDMCRFRNFSLFGNITRPTTVKVTIVAVGSPNGVQSGDTITLAGTFSGTPFTETYTAGGSENAATRTFKVFSSGTASQNIADTADSLIRVINYDNSLPVHVILLSSSTDLPGQLLFEADYANPDTFTVTASAHASAYDPTLTNVVSDKNVVNNGVAVSKDGELEAVPATNLLNVGDSSSSIVRIIPLRDYVIVLKTDGIYKIQGTAPGALVVNPFDLTTKIIGSETAVSLNSAVWMFSNQGVVSISDGGVEAKSVPIDDQLNALIGLYLDNVKNTAFAVGYESDRKYILALPTSNQTFAEVEWCYNYVTSAWTTWSRNLYASFIHSSDNKIYISRADGNTQGVSKERKLGNYTDYVDESVPTLITAASGFVATLDDLTGVKVGDVLFQDSEHFAPIVSIDPITNTVTVEFEGLFMPGVAEILSAYLCSITWKQVFGDNPAFQRQFEEGLLLFKNTRFSVATLRFATDFSQNFSSVTILGTGNSLWGLFSWGLVPWGGSALPQKIRFYIPQDKQLGSYLIPNLQIQRGYSDFKFQGMAITYDNISEEVGL